MLLQRDLAPQRLLPSLAAGLVLGIIGVLTYLVPMAVLIFSGALAPMLATGIGVILLSAAVIATVSALKSSFVGMIALPVPEEMTVLATMAGAIAATPGVSANPDTLLLTVIGAIALTSVLTGVFLLTLGQLKLGDLIRFLPFPVVGGFLGGLGCLLSQGALTVMTDLAPSLTNGLAFLQPALLLRWLPGLVFALALLAINRRYSHFLIMPVSFLAATGLFYLIWVLTGHAPAEAGTAGWLLGPFPGGEAWHPLSLAALSGAEWPVVFSQLGSMAAVMLITTLSLLMVSSGLELSTGHELNLNQELRATGLGCLISGLFGGTVGSHGVTTVLVHKMGLQSRLVGVFTAVLYLLVLVFGISLISFFPKPVLGGLLLYLGLDLLVQWLIDIWPKLPWTDYGIVVLITLMIATVGLVAGIFVGLVVAILKFVVAYSRIDTIKYALSGAHYRSHVQRPLNQERLLNQAGEQIYVLSLQGLLFFGTAHQLFQQIRHRVLAPAQASLQYLLLDFRLVSGLDSSAVLSFLKLRQLLQKQQISLVLAQVSPTMVQQLRQGGVLIEPETEACRSFPDLDRAMEWCENQILAASKYRRQRILPLPLQLNTWLADADAATHLMQILEDVPIQAGDTLFQQGDAPNYLYFLQSGQVDTLSGEGQTINRYQTLGPGTLFGDVEFYTRMSYELSARVEQSGRLYRLSQAAWDRLQQDDPRTAAIFSRWISTLLAERLQQSRREVAALLR